MKFASVITLACGLLAIRLPAQTAASTSPRPSSEITVRRHVLPSPASIRPKPAARPTTAEAGPVHAGWKPLTQLPALALTDRDGKPASMPAATGSSRHWLLLYRTATCVPCDRLMLALQSSGSDNLRAGKPLVIVVDSTEPGALERIHSNFAGLSEATWMADHEKITATTLKLHGAPVMLAMDGQRIAWRVAGSLDSTDTLVGMTNAWLRQNAIGTTPASPASANDSNSVSSAAGLSSSPKP